MSGNSIRVGFVGTGRMGAPMVRNLLNAGFAVTVHNRSQYSVRALVRDGAVNGGSPAGVAAAADVVLTCLTDPAAVRDVYLGDDGLVANALEGQIYIDTSTVDPGLSRELARRLGECGAAFLDAPVSGGVAGADAGTLTIMAGGDARAFERARPVLAALGRNLRHVGPSGAGTTIKLANQLLVGINMAGVAEAFVLAAKAGADPDVMLDVLSTSWGASRMLDRTGPMIVARDFDGGTPVDLLRKDLGLIRDLAASLGVPLATGAQAAAVFDRAHEADLGALDIAAIVLPLEHAAGVEVHHKDPDT